MDINTIILYAIAAVTVISAAFVAFSKNIIHSAVALLGVFGGVFGLFILLSADFVAIVQLVIYIGGILVLILFAVMLTTDIAKVRVTNLPMSPVSAAAFAISICALIFAAQRTAVWTLDPAPTFRPTTLQIGNLLLTKYLLPFEIVSLLLVLVMVGAIVIARRAVWDDAENKND